MRVFFGVAECMVLAVHNGISARVKERCTLEKEGEEVEYLFVEFAGSVHLMRCVPVQKEGLKEQGQEPMPKEKYQYNYHGISYYKTVAKIGINKIRKAGRQRFNNYM